MIFRIVLQNFKARDNLKLIQFHQYVAVLANASQYIKIYAYYSAQIQIL